MAKNILRLGEKIELVVQLKQEGFGNAVLCAKDAIGKDAFLLVLGDHLYKTKHDNKHPCVQQILECYKEICSDGSALIGSEITWRCDFTLWCCYWYMAIWWK